MGKVCRLPIPSSFGAGLSVFVLKINSDKFLLFPIYRVFGLMYFLEFNGTHVFDRIQRYFQTIKWKYTSISWICFFLSHSLHELFSKGKQKLSFNQTHTNTELLVETMLRLNDFLWFPSKTKLNMDFWVEFHFEFLVLFSYEELSETWEVQTLIEWSWKTICKTSFSGVLFHTFDLCGCWEQLLYLFQPIKNRPVEPLHFYVETLMSKRQHPNPVTTLGPAGK